MPELYTVSGPLSIKLYTLRQGDCVLPSCWLYRTFFLSLGPLPDCLAGAKFCELDHAANTTPVPDSHQLAAEGSELMGIWEHWGDHGLISKLIHP